ncbi:hypothetical protein ACP70R_044343 [Stipagrostis hirtigluma subsp. patula]
MATADHKTTESSGAPLVVWDCGSSLYDSYELTAFKRQLDATVLACRSLSMPHLPAAAGVATPAPHPDGRRHRRRRRLPALLRRLFSKVLRLRLFPAAGARGGAAYRTDGSGGAGSPWSGALTSIPEESASSPEKGSPAELGPSALRKAQSERFIGSKTASPMVQFEVVL